MNFYVNFPMNVVGVTFSILSWSVIALWIYLSYKKKAIKLKVWKIIIITLIGIASFSVNWTIFGVMVKFPILPIGAWLLYGYFKNKHGKWEKYRTYAWIGFFSNFIFLTASILMVLFHNIIFPKDEITTYISNVDNAAIKQIHPIGIYKSVNIKKFEKQVKTMRSATIYSENWYADTYYGNKPKYERFPYQLIGTTPKWGSAIPTLIYIEKDGKGVLIDSPIEQVYFRSSENFLEERNNDK